MGRVEGEDWANPETLGLSLGEAKRLSAAIQTEIVRSQAAIMGERYRCCGQCGSDLSSNGYRQVTFRSLFGEAPLRVRRFQIWPCLEVVPQAPRSFSALALEGGVAPELAYVTAKFAALAPFGKVAEFLAELPPLDGAVNAGTVRNRTRRVGERIARLRTAGAPDPDIDTVTPAVVIGLDGGCLRSRHRRPERNFEVIAGKVLNLDGSQHRFAFARNSKSASEFADAMVSAGVRLGTPATVLSDGDAGLWKLQRQLVPEATLLLDWRHIAMRFEHALQAARGIGQGTTSAYLRTYAVRDLESAKWKLWHGRSSACLGRLAQSANWLDCGHVRDVRSAVATRRYVNDLIEYLHANRHALVNYGRRRHEGLPISTAFVESAVNEILSKRMIKKQQMRWNRWTEQPFLDVRTAVLNATLRGSFRRLYPAFQADNDNRSALVAA
ncbi:ISKra4 family transposase [Methylocapsa palsarum]|uniref:ISKra4 family transposase n=1 Tax=Methylocapsa palsarum TaxID=1612308 RepID=UPI001587345F|nr:ISKra4 family transposase [Methylocapsa palsarum]